jgi:hypothetical protein
MVFTPVRHNLFPMCHPHALNFCISVPCEFDTPIFITVGGKRVEISPESFNFGPVAAEGPDRCLGGAASATDLDSKSTPMTLLLGAELTADRRSLDSW